MKTTLIILILALICVGSFARHNFGQNRRHFRPSRDDYPEDSNNGDDSWNEEPEDNNNSWNDEPEDGEDSLDDRRDDENTWRRSRPRRQHNHRRDQTEDSNNEENNIDSSNARRSRNKASNNNASNKKGSNTKASNNNASNKKASNTQATSSASSTSGHLNSDTFSTTDYDADAKFKQQCLDIHNDERASLGIDPVTYNDDLAEAARVWAEQLVQAGSLSHSTNRVHVGENVGYRTSRDDVDSTPLLIGAWLDEKKDFENGDYPDISTSGSVHDVGHYSQMIWGTTKEIGCAVVNGDGRDYMCCQYAPSGNRRGEPVY